SSSASARNVDRDDRPVRMAQETVPNGTCVQVGPRDRPRGIDVDRLGISGAWGIESDDVAMGSPRETVSVEACVKGLSGDGAFRIQGGRHGAVDGPRRIECGDGAIGLAQEAMSHKASVIVKTQNQPFRVNGLTVGAIDRAWGVERGQSAVRRTEEPWVTKFASPFVPVVAPAGLVVAGLAGPVSDPTKVPSPGSVPAPGASNVVMVPSLVARS